MAITVSLTGAAGQIGYALLFRIASGAMFGLDQPVRLQLIEIAPAMKALKGTVMELEDCAFPLLETIEITSDLNTGFNKADWAILVGSVPRKKGMERKDLLNINGGIFTEQGKAISKSASPQVKTLVVGNPCNTNALIAMNSAAKLPQEQFFAMTRLDENRAKSQLAQKAGVHHSLVKNMTIWGNHSATQYPDFHHATINGKQATESISDHNWLETTFIQNVQQRGASIIEARGASSAASAANAIVDSVKALTTPTPQGESYSIAQCSNGEYGVDKGLISSFPTRTTATGKIEIISDLELNEFSQQKLASSIQELREEKIAVSELLK